ncbi:cytochrome c oxidase assembly protein [Devosia sp.]|uniref:cytochrome c oxidase assembly protein n=1 Tax=Devosia sp. TaxID=1871048 RepID=UPI003A92CD9D
MLLAVMALVTGLFWFSRVPTARDRSGFLIGMAVLVVIFVSPLCALTVALFSARVVHHVLLVAVAAPLLAWALIGLCRAQTPRLALALPHLTTPLLVLHTVIFWLWHIPDAYALALSSTSLYWVMQATLLGSALLFWASVLLATPGRAIAALIGIAIQMGLLGALLVFSATPLYFPHLGTTAAFGLSPLEDQQLAGLIMWVPASLPYLLVAVLRLGTWLRSEARQA